MTLLSRVLTHPSFPSYLRSRVDHAYETTNSRGEAEVWLDLDKGKPEQGGYRFYFDADRNLAQIYSANLIVGGRKAV